MPLGMQEIVIGFVVIAALFGATKIPEMARALGRAKSEFRKAQLEGARELEAAPTPRAEVPK